eukprot:1730446-Ditylum_brightwellii.AAC.1
MGATEDTTGRVLELIKDLTGLGRWTTMLFLGGEGIKIRVITSYRVSQKNLGENHDNTTWKQQYQILKSKGVNNLKPKTQWCTDLEEGMKQWKKTGPVILLCNTSSDTLEDDLSSFLSNTGMYDLSAILHRIDSPETYIKGHLTLNYAFGTMDLVSPLKRSRWLAYYFKTFCDHRGIILDFSTKYLLRGEVYRIKEKYLNQVNIKHY